MNKVGRTLAILVSMFLLVTSSSCQNRTYLTDQEKAWNPYKSGQHLLFWIADGRIDSLVVTRSEANLFPDGLGALQNERLSVLVMITNLSISKVPIEVTLVHLSAKTKKDKTEISFELPLSGGKFWEKPFVIEELEKLPEISLTTRSGAFNDVIRLEDNSGQVWRAKDIQTIFWSKSFGYVKCITKDSTSWELVSR
jgi:hypothetical protein